MQWLTSGDSMKQYSFKKFPANNELSEKEITNQIRSLLRQFGIFHWKAWQGLGSTPGVPDILGVYKGLFLGIEVKTLRGKLSPHQENFIAKIKDEGGIAFVARSVDDVIRELDLTKSSLLKK